MNIIKTEEALREISELTLKLAKKHGASTAELSINKGTGFSVEIHMGNVDKLEYNRDQGLSLTVYIGQHQGSATTGDLSPQAIEDTVKAACNIAKFTGEDEYTGLADADLMATQIDDLDLYHPWDLDTAQAIDMAKNCEQVALDFDDRIINSDGSSISTYSGIGLMSNSHGFTGVLPSSRHSISCSVIGQESGKEDMQRDYWYSSSRLNEKLESAEDIGKKAAERTLKRLNSQQLSTRQASVLYIPEMARSLVSHFTSAIKGGAQYRKATFLLDSVDKKVFPDFIRLHEQPHLQQAFGSRYFDREGVATKDRDIVTDGIVQNYIMSSYSARQLGLKTTANSGGTHNLTLDSTGQNFEELLKMLGTGFLVTELIGSGVNSMTGDYSRGAAGFWVENGEIQFPVEEVTVAGNLKDMFKNIVAVGTDVDYRGGTRTGSILIEGLTIAGS
ncbi:MAG TPA: metalloprotease PmbA [Leucothrix sp.]|nr:metalloprotease PmbA [Leucothrix sp.]